MNPDLNSETPSKRADRRGHPGSEPAAMEPSMPSQPSSFTTDRIDHSGAIHLPAAILFLVLLCLGGAQAMAADTFFSTLAPLAGGSIAQVRVVTPDGHVAAGTSATNTDAVYEAATLWYDQGLAQKLPSLPYAGTARNFVTASDLTPDGSVIVGRSRDGSGTKRQAVVWRLPTGSVTGLGYLPGSDQGFSAAAAVSDDGKTVYGWSNSGTPGKVQEAFRWTSPSTMTALGFAQTTHDYSIIVGRACSADGTVAAGYSEISAGPADTTAFIHTTTRGLVPIGKLPGATASRPIALSADGSTVLGQSDSPTFDHVFIWRAANGMTDLGAPPGSVYIENVLGGINSDGTVAVFSSFVGTPTAGQYTGFVWNRNGFILLEDALRSAGLVFEPADSLEAHGLSDDARTIWGAWTPKGSGVLRQFVARVPAGFLANATQAPRPPLIVSDPVGLDMDDGTSPGQLSVGAVVLNSTPSSGQLRYQWYRNRTAIPGATSSTLTLPAKLTDAIGTYVVIVGDDAGSITSRPVGVRQRTSFLRVLSPLTGATAAEVRAASADGQIAVGASAGTLSTALTSAVRWIGASPAQELPRLDYSGSSLTLVTAADITPDGTTITGRTRDGTGTKRQAVLWRDNATTITQLGFPQGSNGRLSVANAISDDGTIVFGWASYSAVNRYQEAWRWTASSGLTRLGVLKTNHFLSFVAARGVSADGKYATGYSEGETVGDDTTGFVYSTDKGMRSLGRLPDSTVSYGIAVASDGRRILGASGAAGPAPWEHLFLWSESTGMQDIGAPPATSFIGSGQAALDTTGSAAVFSATLGAQDSSPNLAFIWNSSNGFALVEDLLTAVGLQPPSGRAVSVNGMSDDGTVLWGSFGRGSEREDGWVAKIPSGFIQSFRQIPQGPVVAESPVDQEVDTGAELTIKASIVTFASEPSSGALRYQWYKDGQPIPGATGPELHWATASPVNSGIYKLSAANNLASVTTAQARILVAPHLTLGEAINATTVAWYTGGDAPWIPTRLASHDGLHSARTQPIANNQSTWLQALLQGPGTLTFLWKVSSENGYDYLDFELDGAGQDSLTGEVDWTRRTFNIPSGPHTVRWTYSKDEIQSGGQDRAWIDEVQYTSNAPQMFRHPANTLAFVGDTVTLSGEASSPLPVRYQWLKNPGANLGATNWFIPGATNMTLTLTNVSIASGGTFVLGAYTTAGEAYSSTAVLTVVPVGTGIRLSKPTIDTTGNLNIHVFGRGGLWCQLQESADMVSWRDLTSKLLPNGGEETFILGPSSLKAPKKFYRALLKP